MKHKINQNSLKKIILGKLKANICFSQSSIAKLLFVGCVFSTLIAPYGQGKAIAQDNLPPNTVKVPKVTFNPPVEKQPLSSKGGASRSIGQCISQAENSPLPLTPILPSNTLGLTVASHPTVFAYLPEIDANKVLFSWQGENEQDHYQTILPITNQAGIVSLTLPEDAPPLEIGKNYRWAIAVMCDGKLYPDSPYIQGQIKRVTAHNNLSNKLQNASLWETAVIYGEAGIWYDTVATLAQLRATQPNNSSLKTNWQELLSNEGLEQVATTSLIWK